MKLRLFLRHGQLAAVYHDALVPLLDKLRGQFEVTNRRASHVEPYGDGWQVDLSPVGGPLVREDTSGRPFRTRAAALTYEAMWLDGWLQQMLVLQSPDRNSLPCCSRERSGQTQETAQPKE